MVRTKADNCSIKAVAAKAPRKSLGSSSAHSPSSSGSSPGSSKAGKYAGGNPVCTRPTPEWQKGISLFLKKQPEPEKENIENMAESESMASKIAPDADEALSSHACPSPDSTKLQRNGVIDDSDED